MANETALSGKIHFNIDVSLTSDEVKDWQPERIQAWFDGVTKVVEAATRAQDTSETDGIKPDTHSEYFAA